MTTENADFLLKYDYPNEIYGFFEQAITKAYSNQDFVIRPMKTFQERYEGLGNGFTFDNITYDNSSRNKISRLDLIVFDLNECLDKDTIDVDDIDDIQSLCVQAGDICSVKNLETYFNQLRFEYSE